MTTWIQHKKKNVTKYWDLATTWQQNEIPNRAKLATVRQATTKKELHFMCFPVIFVKVLMTHVRPLFSFYNPWKHQKTKGFFCAYRGYKMETLARKGLIKHLWRTVSNNLETQNQ